MAKIDFSGLTEFQRNLDQIKKRADKLSKSVPIEEVLTPEFVMRHTRYRSLDALFVAAGGQLQRDTWHFDDDNALDELISRISKFHDFDEMRNAALEEYIIGR